MFMYKCNNQLLSLSPHIMIEKMKKSGKWREEQEKRGNIDDDISESGCLMTLANWLLSCRGHNLW